MDKILNIKKASTLVLILLFFTIAYVLFDTERVNPNDIPLSSNITSLDQITLNLNVLKQQNTPTGSVISDFKNLFQGAYSSPQFSTLRYDLVSALLLVLLPLMAMLIILLSLGVSKKTLIAIILVFCFFTIIPLILI